MILILILILWFAVVTGDSLGTKLARHMSLDDTLVWLFGFVGSIVSYILVILIFKGE